MDKYRGFRRKELDFKADKNLVESCGLHSAEIHRIRQEQWFAKVADKLYEKIDRKVEYAKNLLKLK